MAHTPERLAVLLVEDDEDDFVITRDLLREQERTRFDLEWVSAYEEGSRAIAERRHDVYLIDYRLGRRTGLELVEEAFGGDCRAPVIMLTGHADYEVDLEATLLGVTDFLIKGQLDSALLERSIRYAVRHHATLAELSESQERYELVVHGANDGTWDWDLPSQRIYYSSRWKGILGLPDDAVGDSAQEWLDRVHPEDIDDLHADVEAHLEGVTSHLESEHRVRHRDGTYRWVLARGVAIRDEVGKATRVAGSMTDITEQKAAQQLLLHDALHDSLTGLPNRALFLDRLTLALARSERDPSHRCAVLFLDLDRFKLVNDAFSHAAGDELLVAFARRLKSKLRPTDTLARFGGDEFTVLLDGITSPDEPAEVAERIQRALNQFFPVAGHELVVTASIGIAVSEHGSEPEELMRNADIAMYDAKRHGAGGTALFNAPMRGRVVDRLKLEGRLRRVIESRLLRVAYQPILDLRRGALSGFEALARWPAGEAEVTPAEFIPIAEHSGLIGALGRLVLGDACARLREWRRQDLIGPEVTMSVNVSARQFADSYLVRDIREALVRNGIAPESLRLEITESTMLHEPDMMPAVLADLARLGVRAQIDDFGTGYSSLTFLQHFQGDAVKIDRSFISAMGDGGGGEAIVRAVIALAHNLDLHVVAEGVETEAQLEELCELGCDCAQGFLLAKPLDADAVPALIRSWSDRRVGAAGLSIPLR